MCAPCRAHDLEAEVFCLVGKKGGGLSWAGQRARASVSSLMTMA